MSQKNQVTDLTRKEPLVDRQRRLWAHSEVIELALRENKPLPSDVSEWLHRALKNIACGEDANAAFNVVPEKRGVKKNSFLVEMQRKFHNSFIAEATAPGLEKMTNEEAIEKISTASPVAGKSTIRKNYNKATTDRNPIFSIGEK